MALLMTLTLAAIEAWFGLTASRAAAGCVVVLWVQPDGPAGQGGLRDNDCVASVDGKHVRTVDELVSTLKATKPGSTATVVLEGGRSLLLVPAPRTDAAERKYCEYRAQKYLRLMVYSADAHENIDQVRLEFDGPKTVSDVRRVADAKGRVRLVSGTCEEHSPPDVIDDPAESTVLSDGAVLFFGFDKMKVSQGRGVSLPVPGEADGGDGITPKQ